jgi:hypothetical protein
MHVRAWVLWALSGALLLGFPLANLIILDQLARSAALPSNSDTVMIPMIGGFVLALLATPVVLGVAWICLRRFNPETRLLAWRRDRPARSLIATLAFGVPTVFVAVQVALGLAINLHDALPWHAWLDPACFALCLTWLLGLRAAVIEQHEAEELY